MSNSRCSLRRVVSTTIALSLCLSAGSLFLGATPAVAATPSPLGVYVGSADPGSVRNFNQWLGRPVTWAMDFFSGESWDSIESPGWWLDGWKDTPYRMVYSVPILPDNAGTLQQGATGAYNDHFRKLAQLLVEKGQDDAILRLGWEFNGDWFRWAASSSPGAFVDYWRQIVTTMRSVPGANFKFDWCPNGGPSDMPADRAYPGDAFVDYIGMDFYDTGWSEGWQDPAKRWTSNVTQPFGLQWQRDFAAAHGKPMSYGEWGLWVRPDGHGGGDDPYFISKMHDWITHNDVAYAIYFEHEGGDGAHILANNQFPKAAARFIELFGPSAPAPAPSAPAPSPSAPAPSPSAPAPSATTPAPVPSSPAPAPTTPPLSETPPPGPGATQPDPGAVDPAPTADPGSAGSEIVGGPAPTPSQGATKGRGVKLCKPCQLKSRGHYVRRGWSHRVERRIQRRHPHWSRKHRRRQLARLRQHRRHHRARR